MNSLKKDWILKTELTEDWKLNSLNSLKKDFIELDRWSKNGFYKETLMEQLGNKYKMKDKGLRVTTKELEQTEEATSAKLARHEARPEQYVQNRMFQTYQAKLFERLEKENKRDDIKPGSKKSVRFLNGIWEQPVRYNNIGKWF